MDYPFEIEEKVEGVCIAMLEGTANIVQDAAGWKIGGIGLDGYADNGKKVEVALPESHRLYRDISIHLLNKRADIDFEWGRHVRNANAERVEAL